MSRIKDHRRRSFLAALLAAGSGAALSRLAVAEPAQALDLDSRFAAMDLYAHIRGSRDGRPSAWYAQSIYYGQLDQEAPVPILGAEGLDLVQVQSDGRDRLIETTERVSYYTDLDTGQRLTQWRNVFTDETIPLQKPRITTRTVIEGNRMRSAERSSYVAIDRTGELRPPFLQGNILTIPQEQFATFTASALGDSGKRRAEKRWWSGIWMSFSAPVADLVDPDRAFVAGHGLLFGSAPWYSWLRMGDSSGTSSVRQYLTKFPRADALPGHILNWVAAEYPDLLEKLNG
jgi:hypothetical protein